MDEEDSFAEAPWTESLIMALNDGVDVSVIEFDDYDEDVVIAWAAGLHDIDSNKYKASSLKDLCEVVQRYRKKVPGAAWAQTQLVLENLYGKSRRMFVYRMVSAARALTADVLEALAASKIMPSYIHENKYFVGAGPDQIKRLSTAGRLAVIEIASADLEANKPMTAITFAAE